MFTHPQQGIAHDEVLRLRQEAGKWLKSLRETYGYSQRELAKMVGIEYYTFISQIEAGRGRVPPTQVRAWAVAMKMSSRDMAVQLMRYYDPLTYELVFGDEAAIRVPDTDETLEGRIERLEKLINKLTKNGGD